MSRSFKLNRGQPVAEGRYVAFVEAPGLPEWAYPKICVWSKDQWLDVGPGKVHGWIGPLPVAKLVDLFPSRTEAIERLEGCPVCGAPDGECGGHGEGNGELAWEDL